MCGVKLVTRYLDFLALKKTELDSLIGIQGDLHDFVFELCHVMRSHVTRSCNHKDVDYQIISLRIVFKFSKNDQYLNYIGIKSDNN